MKRCTKSVHQKSCPAVCCPQCKVKFPDEKPEHSGASGRLTKNTWMMTQKKMPCVSLTGFESCKTNASAACMHHTPSCRPTSKDSQATARQRSNPIPGWVSPFAVHPTLLPMISCGAMLTQPRSKNCNHSHSAWQGLGWPACRWHVAWCRPSPVHRQL